MQGGWQPPPGGPGYGGPPGYGPSYPPNPYATGGPIMQPGMPGAQQQYGSYEFNALENSVISKTASRAKLWGWISAVIGGLQLFGGACGSIENAGNATFVPIGIMMLILGVTFVGVGNSLENVVRTQGNDIAHMMQALGKLSGAFLVQSISFLVLMALTATVFFFAVVVALASG